MGDRFAVVDGGAVDAEAERAAEAKRQAVRRALSQEERKHSQKVALVILGACAIVLITCLAIVANQG